MRTTTWFAALPVAHDPAAAQSPLAARPAWGLIGVLVGTLAAVLLVPGAEYYARGALIPSALVMTAGLLLGPVLSGVRNPQAVFRAEHLLMLGLVYWLLLDAVQSNYRLWDVSREAVVELLILTGLFAGAVLLGSMAATLAVPFKGGAAPARRDPQVEFLFGAGVLCFFLGVAEPVATCRLSPSCVVDAFLAPRFATPWYQGEGLQGWNTILHHLQFCGYLLLPIAAAYFHVARRMTWRGLVLFLLSCLFLLFLVREGSRRSVGTVVGAGMLVWLLLQERPRASHYVFLLLGGACLLAVLQVMLVWRDVGFGAISQGHERPQPQVPVIAVDRNLEWMAHVIQTVPERHPHTGLIGIQYIAYYPIPRSVMPNKPVARGVDMPRFMGRTYGPRFSWTCSALGDLYLIGGALAVIVGGLLYGIAANVCSRLLFLPRTVRSRLLYSVVVLTLFVSLRALHEVMATGFVFLAAVGLFWARDFARALIRKSAPAS